MQVVRADGTSTLPSWVQDHIVWSLIVDRRSQAIRTQVQFMLAESGRKDVTVEIVFPVSGDAITTGKQSNGGGAPPTLPNGLAVVPGAAKGMSAVLCSM